MGNTTYKGEVDRHSTSPGLYVDFPEIAIFSPGARGQETVALWSIGFHLHGVYSWRLADGSCDLSTVGAPRVIGRNATPRRVSADYQCAAGAKIIPVYSDLI